MSAAVDTQIQLDEPAATANAAHAFVLRLGGRRDVPPEAWRFAHDAVAEVGEAPEEWRSSHDPLHVTALLLATLTIGRATQDPEAPDARRHLMLGLQRMAEALDRIAERAPVEATRPAQDVAAWLLHEVDVSQADVAELVGVHPRTLARWAKGEASPAPAEAGRLRTVARLIADLRFSLAGTGIVSWFDWENELLDGQTPRMVLSDPERTPTLYRLAGRLRASIAS
jgi:transcriptional regulator with XRE-family HTH domain